MDATLIVDERTRVGDDAAQSLGGKAAALLELRRQGQPVPPFFVIPVTAMQQMLMCSGSDITAEGSRSAAEIHTLLTGTPFPEEFEAALHDHYRRICPQGEPVAVRSSAVAEDGLQHSFAGIFESVLGVGDFESLLKAVRRVWTSALSPRAVAYREQAGLPANDARMGVIVQQMVDASQAGVCFTCNPATGAADEVVIHSLWGVGEGLVSRGLPADSFVVDRSTQAISAEIADKPEQYRLDRQRGGLRCVGVPTEDRQRPSLSDEQVRQVAAAALAIEADAGRPQDIEFCVDAAGRLAILQARPVTTLSSSDVQAAEHAATGNVQVWDNSNIIESYSGVTTPMTFSFIRRAYSIVYHCFAEVMGIPQHVVREHHRTFENMLGLFRGRVYYNLKNWYRLVQLFPGYQYNARFMESMMGVREPLVLEEQLPRPSLLRRWFVEFPGLLKLIARSGWNFCRIRSRVARFHHHFQHHYQAWSQVDFDALPPHEIMQAYETLEDALLWNWKAPIINDFYVMIHYGLLRKTCTNWCGDVDGSLQNDLLCGEGGLLSDEPAREMLDLARMVRADAALQRLFEELPPPALPSRVAGDPQFAPFHERMTRYLDEYGLRCVGELKLETRSHRDEPHRVYQIIRDYVADGGAAIDTAAATRQREREVRVDAERRCVASFPNTPRGLLRRMLFRRILRNTRMGIRNRENMRFARTRIYGLLRQMLRSIGRHFADQGLLEGEDDIFYLTLDEVWDFIRGTAVCTDLRGLAEVRRQEYDRYRDGSVPAPADRFVTSGMAYWGNSLQDERSQNATPPEGTLKGTGCCPGIVAGRTQRILDPARCNGFDGEILVAERTDPGWVPYYPAFSGILIERGSVLSHSAIVAREMGIPTIVGIAGLTAALQSGQHVRMDGRSGTVEILDRESIASLPEDPSEANGAGDAYSGAVDESPSPTVASTTSST
jgi:rifampicin phosphotransferase